MHDDDYIKLSIMIIVEFLAYIVKFYSRTNNKA